MKGCDFGKGVRVKYFLPEGTLVVSLLFGVDRVSLLGGEGAFWEVPPPKNVMSLIASDQSELEVFPDQVRGDLRDRRIPKVSWLPNLNLLIRWGVPVVPHGKVLVLVTMRFEVRVLSELVQNWLLLPGVVPKISLLAIPDFPEAVLLDESSLTARRTPDEGP